uniref:Sulfotransferase n=1 Tax=Callorhinchus milii TaxID=7868 RepID=A0A4W3K611_CALMI
MKKFQKKYLMVILIYSMFLLIYSYLLDCTRKPGTLEEQVVGRDCQASSAPLGWEEKEVEVQLDREDDGNRLPRKQHIYLHATWRTGSSFVGELFNQHPKVFYLYEPMWLMWQELFPGNAKSLQGAVRDMLRSLYLCDFSVLKLYTSSSMGDVKLTTHSVFGWKNNKVICSAPLCHAYTKDHVELVNGEKCGKQCPPRDIKELERECRKYDVIVIKDVRVLDLKVLLPLMQDPSLNFKVIQLMRDPRAVHNSRMKSKQSLVKESIQVLKSKKRSEKYKSLWAPGKSHRVDTYVSSALEVICESWSKDLTLVRDSPSWVRSRYVMVRYEDLVLKPRDTLRALYGFANITVSPATEMYVLNMTKGEGYSSEKPFLISSRDAKEAIRAWRNGLSLWQIQQVEQSCQEAMKVLDLLYKKGGENVELTVRNYG